MMQIENVTKTFGSFTAIDSISLKIPKGQMVGIIGSSGAGKSTLLRMINRLGDPTGGSIVFGDQEITSLNGKALLDWRSRCAMIFQQFNLVKRLDVITNVLMGRLRYNNIVSTLLKLYSKTDRAMAVKALDRVGILDQAFQRCDTLSGGQQQRVAIARALMQEPMIILADEPIASLDPKSAKMVMETLQSINQQDGITVIASLHHLASAREYTQRIIGMAQGRILFDGRPDALTSEKVREIYGVQEAQEELEHDSENVIAMALSKKQTPPPPMDTSQPPANQPLAAEEKAVQTAVSYPLSKIPSEYR